MESKSVPHECGTLFLIAQRLHEASCPKKQLVDQQFFTNSLV